MKSLFDIVSRKCAKTVTNSYSTSFSSATKMLSPVIRQDIYNIYGFVRFADEIVDSFHDYDKKILFKRRNIRIISPFFTDIWLCVWCVYDDHTKQMCFRQNS